MLFPFYFIHICSILMCIQKMNQITSKHCSVIIFQTFPPFNMMLNLVNFIYSQLKMAYAFFSQERAALTAASDPYRYVEKRKPIPDPQVMSSSHFHYIPETQKTSYSMY
jgi:hypothetical protein